MNPDHPDPTFAVFSLSPLPHDGEFCRNFTAQLENGPAGKESACDGGDTGDTGLIPGSGRSPGEGNDNPLQYSCQENPMDRGACGVTVHGITNSQT